MSQHTLGQVAVCPACAEKMREHRLADVRIDRCDRCGGIWLDVHECERLLDDKQAARAALAKQPGAKTVRSTVPESARNCPRDNQRLIQMSALSQPHIKYEMCQSCGGKFFDASELKDLSEFTLRERLKSWLRV